MFNEIPGLSLESNISGDIYIYICLESNISGDSIAFFCVCLCLCLYMHTNHRHTHTHTHYRKLTHLTRPRKKSTLSRPTRAPGGSPRSRPPRPRRCWFRPAWLYSSWCFEIFEIVLRDFSEIFEIFWVIYISVKGGVESNVELSCRSISEIEMCGDKISFQEIDLNLVSRLILPHPLANFWVTVRLSFVFGIVRG
jgi:hypothetical protein